jgi:signal recognition particle receptor subunit beta
MSFLDPAKREINIKIVYYGHPSAGLAENLRYIHANSGPGVSEMSSRTVGAEQFLFFNFIPLALGEIRGFKIRLHLFTVVGQRVSPEAYKTLLKGADGIVFVADGDPAERAATLQSWEDMHEHLQEHGYDADMMPLVVQLDRRDNPAAIPVAELKQMLGLSTQPIVEGNTLRGGGVFDSLKSIARLILLEIKRMSS